MAERRASRGLRPLGSAAAGFRGRDAESEARLRSGWALVVGEALAARTRLLRVRQGVAVAGAWDLERLGPLRQAAALAFPEVQRRVRILLGIPLAGLEVEPCDPPGPTTSRAPVPDADPDPLRALLAAARARAAGPEAAPAPASGSGRSGSRPPRR